MRTNLQNVVWQRFFAFAYLPQFRQIRIKWVNWVSVLSKRMTL